LARCTLTAHDAAQWRVNGLELTPYHEAAIALIDPTKLAELLTLGVCSRGFAVADHFDDERAPIDQLRVRVQGDTIAIVFRRKGTHRLACRTLTMSQLRAMIAAIVATPADESSSDTCEKLIRGEL
jgi:hypothetical protein